LEGENRKPPDRFHISLSNLHFASIQTYCYDTLTTSDGKYLRFRFVSLSLSGFGVLARIIDFRMNEEIEGFYHNRQVPSVRRFVGD
jgi:hypothetical protein